MATIKNNEIGLLGKIPPQAKEVEMSVLGTILMEKSFGIKAFDTVSGILRPECFYVDSHIVIFRAMAALSKKFTPIDTLTVMHELKAMGELERIGGPYYLNSLTNEIRAGENIEVHTRIIYEKFMARELIRITGEIHNLAFEDGEDIFSLVSYAESQLTEIGVNDASSGMTHISTVAKESLNKIEEWRKMDSPITGVPSGYKTIDRATRGWQPGDLIVLGARPSVGKTAFALNLVNNASKYIQDLKEDSSIAVWSLEMKASMLFMRMLSAESNTFLTKLQTGRLSENEMQRLYDVAFTKLGERKIYFDENNRVTIGSVSRKARQLKRKKGLGLIVIDYLQLMSAEEKGGNREQEIAKISRELKNLATELEVPIIALSQLSRTEGAKNISWEYGPAINSLRESGAIEQDADVIGMLWGPSDQDIAQDPSLSGKRKFRIVKQRNGMLITEEFDFNADIQLFNAIGEMHPELPSEGNWRQVEI